MKAIYFLPSLELTEQAEFHIGCESLGILGIILIPLHHLSISTQRNEMYEEDDQS